MGNIFLKLDGFSLLQSLDLQMYVASWSYLFLINMNPSKKNISINMACTGFCQKVVVFIMGMKLDEKKRNFNIDSVVNMDQNGSV